MSLFGRKKRGREEEYNITAIKKTKHYILKFKLKDGGTWNVTLDTKSDLKPFFEQLEDDKKIILDFIVKDEKSKLFLSKNAIVYGSCAPEEISVSEWFYNIGDALGFMETLKLDRGKEVKETYGKIEEELKR